MVELYRLTCHRVLLGHPVDPALTLVVYRLDNVLKADHHDENQLRRDRKRECG